jgi:hypothetical protein
LRDIGVSSTTQNPSLGLVEETNGLFVQFQVFELGFHPSVLLKERDYPKIARPAPTHTSGGRHEPSTPDPDFTN